MGCEHLLGARDADLQQLRAAKSTLQAEARRASLHSHAQARASPALGARRAGLRRGYHAATAPQARQLEAELRTCRDQLQEARWAHEEEAERLKQSESRRARAELACTRTRMIAGPCRRYAEQHTRLCHEIESLRAHLKLVK